MDARQRIGVFAILPALIVIAPLFMPLYARLHPRAPEWLQGDDAFAEVLDSLFLWPIFGALYLIFVWSQPETVIPVKEKRLLIAGVSVLSIIGLLYVAPGIVGLYRDAFGW